MDVANVNATTRHEDELLLCCARVSPGLNAQTRLTQLLQEPLDWQIVLERCWWHRIRPLTFSHLRSQPVGLVPSEFLEELGFYVNELAERNQRLAKLLDEVTDLFENSELRMLVFKGPTLTMDAYGDPSLRECGDLDLLVHRDDFPRAMELLQSHGFTPAFDEFEGRRTQQVFACDLQRDGLALDVHWHLTPGWLNYQVDFDRLWENGLPLSAKGEVARKLRPEDSLVVLSIHGTKHWWERLRWVCDVAELVNRGKVSDWDRVEAEATRTRSLRSVALGLWLAADLLSAELPESVAGELGQSQVVKRLASQVRDWLGRGELGGESRRLDERFLFRMGVCERVRDRLPQLAKYLLSRPRDWK